MCIVCHRTDEVNVCSSCHRKGWDIIKSERGGIMSKIFTEQYTREWTDKMDVKTFDKEGRTKILEHLIKPLPVKSILEPGCNAGYNLDIIQSFGDYKLTGCDISEYALNKNTGDPRIKLYYGDVCSLPFKRKFDLVLLYGTLDWLSFQELLQATREIKRLARKYILIVDYSYIGIGDVQVNTPYKHELLVCQWGKPYFWIRCYNWFFDGSLLNDNNSWNLVRTEFIPEKSWAMTSWLFERRK